VAPIPLRARRIEALLEGRELGDGLIDEAVARIGEEIAPITDIRASVDYRMHMCGVMLRRGLKTAFERMAGGGPPYPTHLI
jgi:carbon-monoxide dehydrogenase medium subunit